MWNLISYQNKEDGEQEKIHIEEKNFLNKNEILKNDYDKNQEENQYYKTELKVNIKNDEKDNQIYEIRTNESELIVGTNNNDEQNLQILENIICNQEKHSNNENNKSIAQEQDPFELTITRTYTTFPSCSSSSSMYNDVPITTYYVNDINNNQSNFSSDFYYQSNDLNLLSSSQNKNNFSQDYNFFDFDRQSNNNELVQKELNDFMVSTNTSYPLLPIRQTTITRRGRGRGSRGSYKTKSSSNRTTTRCTTRPYQISINNQNNNIISNQLQQPKVCINPEILRRLGLSNNNTNSNINQTIMTNNTININNNPNDF